MRVFTGWLVFFSGCAAWASGLDFDSNVPQALRTQVMGDLSLAESIRNERVSDLHREVYGDPRVGQYSEWFQARVSFFGFGDCGGSSSAVACVQGKNDRKIWVTRNYVDIEHPQIARVMTLFHEARHTESVNRNWPHARCPIFFKPKSIWTGVSLKWHFACDRTEYGSYGAASILLNSIARFCTNCSSKVKGDAALYSEDQIKRVIRKSAYRRLVQDFRD